MVRPCSTPLTDWSPGTCFCSSPTKWMKRLTSSANTCAALEPPRRCGRSGYASALQEGATIKEEPLSIRALRGPNIWANGPVLEVTLKSDHGCADALARLTLELQTDCGAKASGTRVISGDTPGISVAVIGIEDEELARRSLDLAVKACCT